MGGAAQRVPRYSIALLSASALGYEILLMRLFSIIQWHHFAYMIISLALLGYGASGSVLALAQRPLLARFRAVYPSAIALFGLAALGCFLLAQRLAFNPAELLWDPAQPLRLLLIYLLLAVPFFFAASAIALALARHRAAIGRIYAADLTGAGLGSLGVLVLLLALFPTGALKALGALGLLAAALAAWELGLPRRWSLALLLGAGAALALPGPWLALQVSPYKGLSQALDIAGTRVIAERSSPLGLLSVVESTAVPWRHAPGLSLLASGEPPPQLAVFTDADAMSAITRADGGRDALGYLDQLSWALPYHLRPIERVLVLGAGGGAEVLQARYHGAHRIDAVELNPQFAALVRDDYRAFGADLYRAPGVRLHIAEARGFVAQTEARYDLIQVALLDAFGAAGAGLQSLNESYLYTVEALQAYLRRLAPGGYLAISRWVTLPPRDTLKVFATAIAALERAGDADPGRRLALIRGWQTATLLIKDGPFGAEEIEALRRFCAERAFDVAYHPGIAAAEVNRYNRLAEPYFHQGALALLGPGRARFVEQYKFDITPARDDRPYFFHFFKWRALPEILALRGQGGMPLLELGYLVLIATLAQALLLSALLILAPLALLRHAPGALRPGRARVFGYFGAIGLAFLFVEIAFMQRFVLFLHHPLYAAAAVLAGFLVFAGLGSAWSRRYALAGRGRGAMRAAALGIAALGLGYALTLGALFEALGGLPVAAKGLVSLALIAPLAFCMGMPFPLALARLGEAAPELIPWAWGVNGCASVLSAVLATLLAIHAGFGAVVLAALALYALAAACFPS